MSLKGLKKRELTDRSKRKTKIKDKMKTKRINNQVQIILNN